MVLSKKNQDILQRNFENIVNELVNAEEIGKILTDHRAISNESYESILSKDTSLDKNRSLSLVLMRSSDACFHLFVQSLNTTFQQNLAAKLKATRPISREEEID